MLDLTTMSPAQMTLLGFALCVMLTMHFTVQLPKEQKPIIMIVLMAPIYAISDFMVLLGVKGSESFFMLLDSVKECCEALVIAKFLAMMYNFLNISMSKGIVPDEFEGREIHHSFPMTLFQPRTTKLDQHTLKLLEYWAWQSVVIRPLCSILMITCIVLGIYPSWLSWTFTMILNLSVALALYSLVISFHVFAKELGPHKPLAKFMCIKGIVFLCFWQAGSITVRHFWLDIEHLQEVIHNALVSLYMVVFSIIQHNAYHIAPYSGET